MANPYMGRLLLPMLVAIPVLRSMENTSPALLTPYMVPPLKLMPKVFENPVAFAKGVAVPFVWSIVATQRFLSLTQGA